MHADRILTFLSVLKMFLKIERIFWSSKCIHCSWIKFKWRYLHCISQLLYLLKRC